MLQIELAFTSIAQMPSVLGIAEINELRSPAFLARPNPGATKHIGARTDRTVVQRDLVPTSRFRHELLSRVPGVEGPRFPFRLPACGHDAAITLRLKQLPPIGARVTALLRGLSIDGSEIATDLIAAQEIRRRAPINDLLRRSLGMMVSSRHRGYDLPDPPSTLCAVHLVLPPTETADAWVDEHRQDLVATLLRTAPRDLRRQIVKKIISESAPLNEKSRSTYTLISRSGLVHVSVQGRDLQPDFAALVEQQALAAGVQDFLFSFGMRRTDAIDVFDFYLALARSWIEHPSSAMPNSYGNIAAWSRLCTTMQLGASLEQVLTNDVQARLSQRENTFAIFRDAYWRDPQFEQRLADRIAGQDRETLGFVQDEELRRIIRRDLREARTCIQARAYKAALVIAGSVAEALLLAALLAWGNPDNPQAFSGMGINQLAQETRQRNIPVDPKTLNLVDQWLRHYRNLIHPGKERITGDRPDESKADLAVKAVELLAHQLSEV